MTKKEFLNQIIEGIKAGRLDPCNGIEFGEIDANRPQYYWHVVDGQVVEGSPYYVDQDQSGFHFGVTISDIEGYAEKEISELSNEEIKQAMLDIIDGRGTDDWYQEV